MKKVIIYTDGACSYNPGPGGWGCVLIYKNIEKQMSGFCENTTNNRMELLAVIKSLEQLKEPCEIDLYSDSAYVINAILNNWLNDWVEKGWKTANKKPVKNIDLWEVLLDYMGKHKIMWHKVKGHSDNYYNNICDKLATNEVNNWLKDHPEFKKSTWSGFLLYLLY